MRRAFIVSLVFHAGLAGLVVGLSWFEPELPVAETPVTVEIVTEPAVQAPAPSPQPPRPPPAEAAPMPQRQAAAPAPPPPPAPKVEPEAEAKPAPPPPPPAPVAEAKPEPPPPPQQAEPRPEPEPAPSPAPERAEARPPVPAPPRPQARKPEPPPEPPAEAKPEPRKEVAKASPKPEKPRTPPAAKSEASDFDALLRSVEAQNKRVQAPEKRAGDGAAAEIGGTDQAGEATSAQVNPSVLVAAVSRQVTPCWNIPIAAQGVGSLRAELAIELGPDGAVQTVAPTDTARMASDPVFRAFAESAVRAVRSCSPLKLPPESYQVWRNIIFNFEPSMMAG